VDPEAMLRRDGRIVPLGAIVGAEDLDQARRSVVRDLGDDVVAVLGPVPAAPRELAAAAAPAAGRVERPTAAREDRAAEESWRRRFG